MNEADSLTDDLPIDIVCLFAVCDLKLCIYRNGDRCGMSLPPNDPLAIRRNPFRPPAALRLHATDSCSTFACPVIRLSAGTAA